MTTSKDQLISVQHALLDKMVAMENGFADLYERLLGLYSDVSDFFGGLAREERLHAKRLAAMRGILASGRFFYDLGGLEATVDQMLAQIGAVHQQVETERPSLLDALKLTQQLESMLTENNFYERATTDLPAFDAVARRLAGETREHVTRTVEQINRLTKSSPTAIT